MGIDKKRVFIALPLANEFKKHLGKAIFDLKGKYLEFRWLSEENWHITLVPPNDLSPAEIQKTRGLIENKVHFKKFRIQADKIVLGPVGNTERRMIWLIFKNSPEFLNLRARLNGLFSNLENLETRPGNIHVTLAKFSRLDKPDFKEKSFPHDFVAEKIEIWESRIFSSGSVYNSLASFKLL
jgi:2'-5' RNA ligase